jgi:hypothetical protein
MGWDGGDQLRVATVDQPYRACAVRDLLQPLPRRTECPVTCMVDGLSAGPNAFSASLSEKAFGTHYRYGTHYRESGRQTVPSLTAGSAPVPSCHPSADEGVIAEGLPMAASCIMQ